LECAEALSGLDTALQQSWLSLDGDAIVSVTGQNQMVAALNTITGCLLFARHLQLSRNDAFRVAKGFLQLAFGSGQAALAAAAEAARAAAPNRHLEAHVSMLLTSSTWVVFTAGRLLPARQHPSAQGEQPESSCYSMAARAESWLPWLATVADAMLLCYTPPGKTGAGCWALHEGLRSMPRAGSACCCRLMWLRLLPWVCCRRVSLA
jgi:hypothetical protein